MRNWHNFECIEPSDKLSPGYRTAICFKRGGKIRYVGPYNRVDGVDHLIRKIRECGGTDFFIVNYQAK